MKVLQFGMKIKQFPHYIFWSYSPQADLPEELIAEQVILYGDLDDLFRLSDMVSDDIIAAACLKIMAKGRWEKRCHFVNKVILSQ
jgi:hypothetical protein